MDYVMIGVSQPNGRILIHGLHPFFEKASKIRKILSWITAF